MYLTKDIPVTIDDIFHPESIAIVGASESPFSPGSQYMNFVYNFGFKGKIYPITPKSKEVMGLKAYANISEVPDNIDYVISCVSASLVKDMIAQCGQKKVKCVHLFTARLSETGNIEAKKLEQDIAIQARENGIHLIGPNCMGLYHPKLGISFNHDLPDESGYVGAILQSGGIGGELVRYSALRGIRFSKAVSYGNAVDINECDLLEYFLWDDETKIIVMYIEGVREGRRFFELLKKITPTMPVIILKAGRSEAGIKSVASHTASIAGSMDIWEVIFRQCGAIQASSLNELIDITVAFYLLPEIKGKNVGVVGGGGGKSVLAADECEEAGLKVVELSEKIKQYVESKSPGLANWLRNPVDFSIIPGLNIQPGEMLNMMAEDPNFHLLIGNIAEDAPMGKDIWSALVAMEINEFLNIANQKLKPIVVIMSNPELGYDMVSDWRWDTLFKQRERVINAGIPIYSNVSKAATALNKMIDYYVNRG